MVKKKKAAAKKGLPIPTVQTDFRERNGTTFLGIIMLAILALRVIALASMNGSLYGDFLLWDERIYHQWAQKIADGSYASKSVYEFSPLTAYAFFPGSGESPPPSNRTSSQRGARDATIVVDKKIPESEIKSHVRLVTLFFVFP